MLLQSSLTKNKEAELKESSHEVAGMLLYAKTDEEIQPDNEYWMSGNKIGVKTLDLSGDFDSIEKQAIFSLTPNQEKTKGDRT